MTARWLAAPALIALAACTAASGGPIPVFVQDDVQLVASHDRLVELGLLAWPDSLIGFADHPEGHSYAYAFGTDGDVMRATLNQAGTALIDAVRTPVEGPPPAPFGWFGSGGPVYHDPDTDLMIMITHHEAPDVSLRIAKSQDWGETWHDLGLIIDHESQRMDMRYMGNGGFVIHEEGGIDYIYVYHGDGQGDGRNQTAVSRAPLREVLDDAIANRRPEFHKWNGIDWSEPGLGGRSVDLMPGHGTYGVVGDFDPYWVPAIGAYMGFYPTQIRGDVDPPTWNVFVTTSRDAIHWREPVKVYPEDLIGGDPIYTGVRAHNRVITDENPHLYRLWCTDDDDRWGSSTLELVRLRLSDRGGR